jgi:ParB family chromosome partitioning protein
MNNFKLKKGLGRGLSSLIGDSGSKSKQSNLKIDEIISNPYQPRKTFDDEQLNDLTNSIKERGIIQPIVVRPSKSQDEKFEIIAGERRWLAAKRANLDSVPVVILNVDDEKSLEFAIVENVQRQDLNPIEEAKGYQKLIDEFNYNQEKLSKFIGKSRSYIANSLRLLSLSPDVIDHTEKGDLTAGHARALIGVPNSGIIAKKIIKNHLSVRQVENLVKVFKNKNIVKLIKSKDSNIIELQKSLENKMGLSVIIQNKKNNSGKITFEYKNLDQLDKIIDTIKNNY